MIRPDTENVAEELNYPVGRQSLFWKNQTRADINTLRIYECWALISSELHPLRYETAD